MPNRIIRESIRTSPNANAVGADAFRLFVTEITVADDYGCFDADPRVMLAQCFPLKIGEFTVEQVTAWRDECVHFELMRLYEHRGRIYGFFPTWFDHQRPARSKRKFPAPPKKAAPLDIVGGAGDTYRPPQVAADCEQLSAPIVSRESLDVSRESVSPSGQHLDLSPQSTGHEQTDAQAEDARRRVREMTRIVAARRSLPA